MKKAGAQTVITSLESVVTREAGHSESLQSVTTLAATVSHEINNPLMAIIGNLELLEAAHTLDPYGRARVGAALAAAAEIKETIHQLASITRLELAAGAPNLPAMLDLEKSTWGTNGAH